MPELESDRSHCGHRQRLRRRFQKTRLEGLADYEIVELILPIAIPRSDVKQPAKRRIQRFRNLLGILDAPIKYSRSVDGVGEVAPVALKVIRSAAILYLQQSAGVTAADPHRLAKLWRMRFGSLPNEVFQVAYLGASNRLLFPYDPNRVDEAGRYFDRVLKHMKTRNFAVSYSPESGICKESDVRSHWAAEGVF